MSVAIREGFQVLPGLLAPVEIAAMRGAINDSIDRLARVMLTPYETSFNSTSIEERLERAARKDRAYASALLQVAAKCATVRVACWMPLSDVDEESGALEVLPGRRERPYPHEVDGTGHFGIPDDALPLGEPSVVPKRCGEVLLLDRFVPHGRRPTHGLNGRWS